MTHRYAQETTVSPEKSRAKIERTLALGVLAKLERVESGIATFEEEFLPYTTIVILPDIRRC